MDDRQEFLDQFLLYGHVLTAEEIEAAGEEGVTHSPPTLEQYKEQVDTYEKIYMDVKEFEVNLRDELWLALLVDLIGNSGIQLGVHSLT